MQFSAHKEAITRILLSPDVKKLATCSADHTAKIWEVRELDLPSRRGGTRRGSARRTNGNSSLRPPSAADAKGGSLPPTINEDDEGGSGGGGNDQGRDDDEDDDDVDPSVFPPPYPGPGAVMANGNGGFAMNGSASPFNAQMSGLQISNGGDLLQQQQQQAQVARLMYPYPLEATLTGHQRWVWDCAFSADSAYLVTACSDHYARLWELHSQQIIRQYNGHHRGAVCVALNDYSETR
jgi:target of rapamycin complex subunit LST8